jgi:hypothetical protein
VGIDKPRIVREMSIIMIGPQKDALQMAAGAETVGG